MMRIAQVETFEIEGLLQQPWKIATDLIRSLRSLVVVVTLDDGTKGYGECCSRGGTAVLRAVIEDLLKPVVVGRSPFDTEAVWEAMYATLRTRGHSRGFLLEAMSGIDIAIWDVAARKRGCSIAQLMMGQGRSEVRAYASSVLIDTPEAMAQEAGRLASAGYDAIKIKIAGDVNEDAERVRAVRLAIGPDVRLAMDANSGFDAAGAVAFADRCRDADVFWLEEPVFLDDLPAYRRIRAGTTSIRIALGEGEFTTAGFRPFLEEGLIDVVQPNVTRAGGFTGVRRIAALAQAFGVAVAPHTGASGPICMAATLQLAGALTGFEMHEHMYLENPFKNFFVEPLPEPRDGRIAIPQGAGLGIEINPQSLRQYARSAQSAAA